MPLQPILPAPVRRGSTIGLVLPAGPVCDENAVQAGMTILQDSGYRIKYRPECLEKKSGYLASSDQERLQEFHRIWSDPEIAAVLAVRGGYGTLRLLPSLDLSLIRNNPKPFFGFSDITALQTVITCGTGLVTYHAPVLTTLHRTDRTDVQAFFSFLSGRIPESIKAASLEILRRGSARGRLLGGNLTTLAHLLATPHEPSWDNTILFLEDVDEAPYRVDRLLTHLHQAGRLQRIAGLILGSFNNAPDLSGSVIDEEAIWQRVLELFHDVPIPIWANFPAGHGLRNHPLPLGLDVEMDGNSGMLHFTVPT